MTRKYLAILFVFVGTAVVSAADERQEYVEQDFGSFSADQDPHYSSVTAAKNGFRVFTNTPETGMIETLSVTYRDGLYVAGEKVVTEGEHRRVVRELESRMVSEEEHRRVANELQTLRSLLQSFQPPVCTHPGGSSLLFDGTQWLCVCHNGYTGPSCDMSWAPTAAPHTRSPTATQWVKLLDNAYYTGTGENQSVGFAPLTHGSFSKIRAVYRSGYIHCYATHLTRTMYHWQECAPFVCDSPYTTALPSGASCFGWSSCQGYSFELEKNGVVELEQTRWCNLPPSCTIPSTVTGDIICDLQLLIQQGDTLRPTWFEERTGTGSHRSDNGGVIYIDLYGAV